MANPLKLKRLPQPTVRMKVLPAFPARVVGGAGVTITKANGTYTISSSALSGPESSTNNAVARFVGVTGDVLADSRVTISDGGTVAIAPAPNTNNRGIDVTQTSPSSGSVAGPLDFNKISVENRGGVTSVGGDPFATHEARALHIHMQVGGPSLKGFQNGLRVRLNHTIADSDIEAGDFIAGAFVVDSTKNATGHGLYALNPVVWARPGAGHGHVVGINPEVGVFPGSAVEYRSGIRLQTWGGQRASVSDSALTIVSGFGDPTSSWKNGITLNEYGGSQSIASDGDLLKSNSALTLANAFNLSNVTVTGNILEAPHARLTGGGLLTLNQGDINAPSMPPGSIMHLVSASTATEVTIDSFGGAGGSSIVVARKARGTNALPTAVQSGDLIGGIAFAGWGSTGYSSSSRASLFVTASQTWTDSAQGTFIDLATTPNGSTAKATRVRINASGGVAVGHTGDPGTGNLSTAGSLIASGALASGGTGVGNGQVILAGNTAQSVTQTVQATAGNATVTWGTNSGTPVVTASSPLSVATATGNLTISGSALTKTDDANVTLTLGGPASSALLAAVSLTLGWTGVLAESRGGTGVNAAIYGTFYKSANQIYTASAPAKVLIDTVETNQGLTFDGITNNRVTIVKSGRYLVTLSVYISGVTAGDLITGRVKKNGTTDLVIALVTASTSGVKEGSAASSKVVALTAGDYLEIYGSAPTNGTIHGSSTLTFISIEYVGA